MRIRIFQAFASNNSGSYTIVGTFESPQAAEEVAALLRVVCAEHDVWHEQYGDDQDGESPLDVFARDHGLSEQQPGRSDSWPEHGAAPSLTAVGHQVLLHAPYTVTMPRLFGELFYKRGGRVDVEFDHAHDQLAIDLAFYVSDLANWNDPERQRRFDAVERDLVPLLPVLTARAEHDTRPQVEPVFYDSSWGGRHLAAIFRDLVEAIAAVRVVAERHSVALRVRIQECPHGVVDPLAHLRASTRPWGRSRVILWSIGADRVRAMKALREVMGSELAEAKSAIEGLPKEVLIEADQAYAERATEILRAAGCDAEVVVPRRAEP